MRIRIRINFKKCHYLAKYHVNWMNADKASNNVIIVWRLHYVDVLNQEHVNTKSYTSTTLSEHDLVADHLPTMYWIPKLNKSPYKARFIANSSSCTTTLISKLLTSCLIKVKEHVKRYCDKTYDNSGINLFCSKEIIMRS